MKEKEQKDFLRCNQLMSIMIENIIKIHLFLLPVPWVITFLNQGMVKKTQCLFGFLFVHDAVKFYLLISYEITKIGFPLSFVS